MAITNLFRYVPSTIAEWDRFFRGASLSIGDANIESFNSAYREVSEDYSATKDDYIINVTGAGSIVVTLPVTVVTGKPYVIKNSSSSFISITREGGGTLSLGTSQAVTVQFSGSEYIPVSNYA